MKHAFISRENVLLLLSIQRLLQVIILVVYLLFSKLQSLLLKCVLHFEIQKVILEFIFSPLFIVRNQVLHYLLPQDLIFLFFRKIIFFFSSSFVPALISVLIVLPLIVVFELLLMVVQNPPRLIPLPYFLNQHRSDFSSHFVVDNNLIRPGTLCVSLQGRFRRRTARLREEPILQDLLLLLLLLLLAVLNLNIPNLLQILDLLFVVFSLFA